MARLSDTFKYISHFRSDGHQVGRKIGDMLEVLTYSALANCPPIRERLVIEPKLFGFTDAGHKVEFAILREPAITFSSEQLREIVDPTIMACFVECKKVGVEQTVSQSFKKRFYRTPDYFVPLNETINIPLSGVDSVTGQNGFSFVFQSIDNIPSIIVTQGNRNIFQGQLAENQRYIFCSDDQQAHHFIDNSGSLRDIQQSISNCKILDIVKLCADTTISCVLNDCLPGPQTPEKAKQSSFVALDVRKLRTNSFDKRDNEQELISILVLTEANHWETKSRNMIKACIDINLIVDDSIIVEAFELFERNFGSDFYNFITKDNYRKNDNVRNAVDQIVLGHQLRIFKELDTGIIRSITWSNGQIQLA